MGQGEACCAFLSVGPKGWECLREDPRLEIYIEKRIAEGTITAKGEGYWEGCLCRL